MNNLLQVLKAGDIVYSMVHGKPMKIKAIDLNDEMPILIGAFKYNTAGSIIPGGIDCLLFPTADDISWLNFSPFKSGDIVLATYDGDSRQAIGVFSHRTDGFNYVIRGFKEGQPECEKCLHCEYVDIKHLFNKES
jgi:hypothetical protein